MLSPNLPQPQPPALPEGPGLHAWNNTTGRFERPPIPAEGLSAEAALDMLAGLVARVHATSQEVGPGRTRRVAEADLDWMMAVFNAASHHRRHQEAAPQASAQALATLAGPSSPSVRREDLQFLTNWLGEPWYTMRADLNRLLDSIPQEQMDVVPWEDGPELGPTLGLGGAISHARPRLVWFEQTAYLCADVEAWPRIPGTDQEHNEFTVEEMRERMQALHDRIVARITAQNDPRLKVYHPFWADDEEWNLGVLIPLDKIESRADAKRQILELFLDT